MSLRSQKQRTRQARGPKPGRNRVRRAKHGVYTSLDTPHIPVPLTCVFVLLLACSIGLQSVTGVPTGMLTLVRTQNDVGSTSVALQVPKTGPGDLAGTYPSSGSSNVPGSQGVSKHRAYIEATIQRIVSRVTSEELEEKNYLEEPASTNKSIESSSFPSSSVRKVKDSKVAELGEDVGTERKIVPRKVSRIVTIPMSAVPPRVQVPGSSKGMPAKVRLVEIDRSHQRLWQKMFRRSILATTSIIGKTVDKNTTSNLVPPENDNALHTRTYSVDLHGGIVGVGEYYSVIELGGKRIRVQVDTGSSTLAVPMSGCKSCIQKANRYSVEDAYNAQAIKCDSDLCAADRCTVNCPVCSSHGACCAPERPSECGFSLRYADGSAASGSLISDEVRWGELRTNVTFGGILSNSPNFERPEVDGILGMAYKSLACNPSCFDPPFDSLVKDGVVDDIFSICMTSTGGKLMLGGFTPSVAKSEPRYVPLHLSDPPRYYRVKLGGSLKIGDEDVAMPNFKTAIVDTGTTLIVTSTRTFAAIKDHFQRNYCEVPELCGPDSWFQSGMCVSLSAKDLARLPTLTFKLGEKIGLELSPNDYMLEYRRGSKKYRCVGIMGMDGLGGMVVLGNTLMQRYITVYDRENARIGFAEAAPNCGDP